MKLPNDPIMLLSAVNTQLRDNYSNLDELCSAAGREKSEIESKLASVGYKYDAQTNQFI